MFGVTQYLEHSRTDGDSSLFGGHGSPLVLETSIFFSSVLIWLDTVSDFLSAAVMAVLVSLLGLHANLGGGRVNGIWG